MKGKLLGAGPTPVKFTLSFLSVFLICGCKNTLTTYVTADGAWRGVLIGWEGRGGVGEGGGSALTHRHTD